MSQSGSWYPQGMACGDQARADMEDGEVKGLAGGAQIQDDLKVLRHEVLRSGEAGVQLPVNLKRLIWNAQQIFHCQPHRRGPSGAPVPERVKRSLQTLCKYSSEQDLRVSVVGSCAASDSIEAWHCMRTHLCACRISKESSASSARLKCGAWGRAQA